MSQDHPQTHVHLVGAIGIDTVPETFKALGTILGDHLKRVPDGEPGGRRMWIAWQFPLLRANPFLTAVPAPNSVIMFPQMRLADGVAPQDLHFSELGYAREAMASYVEFKEARTAGKLPKTVRFQVTLPTPYAVISAFCVAADAPAIEPVYERAMMREIATICSRIPAEDLTIQWDVCPEMVAWDGRMPRIAGNLTHEQIMERMVRICGAVPNDVELGFHLCYGDVDGKHFIEPKDAGKLVEFANALCAQVKHPVAYIHMPVPIERTDEDYFKPLANLKLGAKTELFLGCVHAKDGVAGTRRRMEAARKYVEHFGIATECGMGRSKTQDTVLGLLKVHAGAAG